MTGTISATRKEILKVEWKIEDFLSLKGSAGSSWRSPTFRFSDTLWYLSVCPNGREKLEDFVALYLYPDQIFSPDSPVVIFTLAIKKADGTLLSKDPITWKFQDEDGYGCVEMISRSELQERRAELMPNGAVTFSCILNNALPIEAMDTLSLDFKKLLESSTKSDVKIKLQSKEYRAHKAVLSARSDTLASALQYKVTNKESGVISIENCDPDSFKEFLQYLYTGRADITESNVFHLYKTANQHQAGELKSLCKAFLMENMSVDNVCDIITLADQYDEDDLTIFYRDFFCEKAGSILLTSKWKLLMKNNCRIASELLERVAPKLVNED